MLLAIGWLFRAGNLGAGPVTPLYSCPAISTSGPGAPNTPIKSATADRQVTQLRGVFSGFLRIYVSGE